MGTVDKSFVADIKVIAFIVLIFPNFISPLTHYLKGFQFFFSNFHGAFDLKTLFLFKKVSINPNLAAPKHFHMQRVFHIERVPRENQWRMVIDMQNMNEEREREIDSTFHSPWRINSTPI